MDRKLAKSAAAGALSGDLEAVRAAVAQDAAIARHWSVLMNACFGGQPEVAAFLIDEGADVNVLAPTAHRYRPLHRAVEHKRTIPKTPGHTAAVRLLLEHGADPSSGLDYACWSDNAGIVKLLLQRGARLGDDDTVNHLACDGQFRVLDLLLRHDAVDMNGTRGTDHHGGYNPLGCAVNMRSLKGVTWFLDHGCDPDEVQSKNGETALHVAVNSGAGVPWCACW